MHSSSLRNLGILVLSLVVLVACKKTPPPKAERVPEPYTTTPAAVRFDIFPAGGSEGAQSWLASYTDGDRSTKFRIEMGLASAVQDRADMSSGVGRLVSEPGSDPTVLLASLKVALQAKHILGQPCTPIRCSLPTSCWAIIRRANRMAVSANHRLGTGSLRKSFWVRERYF